MKSKKQNFVLTAVLVACSVTARAAIVDLGTITRDTSTGLEWLDVTETRGQSYNEVVGQLGVGGALEGWRYANTAELDQLIINFGYIAVNTNCTYGELHCDDRIYDDSVLVETMIKTLGDTYDALLDEFQADRDTSSAGAAYTFGILGSRNYRSGDVNYTDLALIADDELVSRIGGESLGDGLDRVQTVARDQSVSSGFSNVGSFLVRTAVVPIPPAIWLFASGLALLGWRKRVD